MFCGWFLLLTLDYFAIEAYTLSSNLMQEVTNTDQTMRPKGKNHSLHYKMDKMDLLFINESFFNFSKAYTRASYVW